MFQVKPMNFQLCFYDRDFKKKSCPGICLTAYIRVSYIMLIDEYNEYGTSSSSTGILSTRKFNPIKVDVEIIIISWVK